MKRFIPLILAIVLISAGCTFSPFDSANYTTDFESQITGKVPFAVINISPADKSNIQDLDNTTDDVEGRIYIYFNDYLSSTVATVENFDIYKNTTSGDVDDLTVTYEKNFKRVKIEVTLNDSATYSLRISADNVISAGGCFLDGNDNNIEDGSPYDDIIYQFGTGGSSDWADITNPLLQSFGPKLGGTSINSQFFVNYNEYMDSASVVNNVFLYDEDDNEEEIELIWYDNINYDEYYFQTKGGVDLATTELYTFLVKCGEITDTCGNVSLHPATEFYTVDIPDLESKFLTEATGTDDDQPPNISNVTFNEFYMLVEFNDTMDVSTLTSDNIKLYANFGNGLVYVPGDIVVKPGNEAIEYSLINFDWNEVTYARLIVSKDVMDAAGWNLDSNGNLIGGEDAYILRYGYEDSDNYMYEKWF